MSVNDRLAALTPEQRALFEALRQKQRQAAPAPLAPPPIERVSGPGGEGDWPLTFDQERLWFLHVFDPKSTAYNMVTAIRLTGALTPSSLEAAANAIVRRHGAWRTTFPLVDDRPVQRVAPDLHLPLPVVDLSELPPGRREALALRLAGEAARQPFSLAQGPLVRLLLTRLAEREHICVLTVHHIVGDLISLDLFWRELAVLHAGGHLPEPPVQLVDFAVWQRRWLAGEVLQHELDWWREQLQGFPLVLDLPGDRPRPAEQSGRGGRHPLHLDPAATAALRALARDAGATRFMAFVALCAALFHRLSGQDRLIVGTVNANRGRPEVESLLGFFPTQLPLPIDLRGDPSFREMLARARAVAVAVFAHQHLPFGKLVETLRPERDTSRMPIVQTLVQLVDIQGSGLGVPGEVASEALQIYDGNARYDLMLALFESAGAFTGPLEYNADLFDRATAVRMAEMLSAMLAAAAADPEVRLADLPAFGAAARHQILVEWSGAGPVHPPAATLHGRFAAQAARTPDAVAVVGDGEALTYAELGRRAAQVAGRLLRAGIAPETRIAVPAERSVGLIPTLLGILQAGCAYLPVDPELPEERRRFLLEDAGAIFLDDVPVPGAPAVPEVPVPAVFPDQLAYVLYTSGSTGAPKGVAVTHANVLRLVTGARYARLGSGETFLQVVNVAFDVSTLEIWGPLLNGGRVAVFPGRRPALDELAAAIVRHGVTTLWLTSGLFHQMVQDRLETLRPLRQLLAGGDVLAPAAVRRALEGLPGCALINGYGPTECTTFTTCHVMTAADLGDERLAATVPIGRPIQDTPVHVLDADLRPVPVGVWGELFAGGGGVARGYLARPALTAERFVPDPWGDGGRLYRTGDVVRWRPDGLLEFLGRRDNQVKIRGFRIELGEIEAALAGHPSVRETVVVPWERDGDRRLAAYVVGEVEETELRRHLAALLPEPMIPAAFVFLDRLPLTANGKVDRRALPAPDPAAGKTREYLAPSNAIEESLAAACAEILGLERVGMRDNFFDLGGHSLLATRLMARLRDQYGLEVPLQMMFEAADLLDLANRLVGQVMAEVGDLSLEDLQALLAGEPTQHDGAV